LLRQRLPHARRHAVHALPPPAAVCHDGPRICAPYRFVFIGGDLLAQNRLSIDVLLELWQRLTPATPLHIYGRQQRANRTVPNVHWHGFVEQVSDAYEPGSILLLPVVLAGGIKTKVIEAWSFGCPVLGNPLAFEGLELQDYPLIHPTVDWERYLLDPNTHTDVWHAAARIGNAFVRTTLSRERFAREWSNLMIPE
jgi:glycosyltransferase involved in cell wall biosynthesis